MRMAVVRRLPLVAAVLSCPPCVLVAQTPVVTSVVNGATFSALPGIASGAWLTVFGSNLSTVTRSWTSSDFVGGKCPTTLSGVTVTINGKPAFLSYVSPTQLNVLAPDDPAAGTALLRVTNGLSAGSDFAVSKAALSPGLFQFTFPPAVRYPAAQHLDYSLAGPYNLLAGAATTPARPGDVILLYGTGFGATKPATATGTVPAAAVPLEQPVTATIGSVPSGVAGYLIGPGLYQFNVTVPDVPDGDAALVLTVGGQSTPSGVFLRIARPLPNLWISLLPSTALLAAGQTRTFTARDNQGSAVAVSWSAKGGGSIDSTGLYTAPATVAAQTQATVTATLQADAAVSASAAVIVLPFGSALYGSALEPALAIGGPSDNPTTVVTWYQDFAPFPGRNGAMGLMAAISHDGRNWTSAPVPVARCVTSGGYVPPDGLNFMMPANARVAVGPDGTIYVVSIAQLNMRNNLSLVSAAMQPGAAKWTAVPIEDDSGSDQIFHADEPSITADPNAAGTAYAVWMHTSGYTCSSTAPSPQYCPSLFGMLSITRNYGRSWSAPLKLPVSGDWHNFAWPRLLVDPTDRQTLYIYFADWQSAGSADIGFIRSTDGGQTWGRAVTVVSPGDAASTEFGVSVNARTGNFHLAYVQPGSVYGIAAVTSADRGATWSKPVRFASNVSTSVSMALSNGTLAVAYQSYDLSAGYSVTTSADGVTWSKPAQFAAVDSSIAPNGFLGDYLFEVAGRGGPFGIAYANTFPGVRPSAAIYYTDLAGTTTLLSAADPLAGCTVNPLP